MTPEKQRRAYGLLIFFAVALLLGAQFALRYTLERARDELVSAKTPLSSEDRTMSARRSLNDRYKLFQQVVSGHAGTDRKFPVNGRELYTALDEVLRVYDIDFTNSSPNAGVQPGAGFTLQITFSGRYYDVMKALAAIRESGYLMRISELKLAADGAGGVRGTMNIVSVARARS